MPALRALRRAFPSHELVLAAPPALWPLVELAGVADRLMPARGLGPLQWAGAPPDVAVNLHGKGPQTHRLLQALDPGRLVAFGCPEAGFDGPPWLEDEHEVRRWCRLLEVSLRIPTDPRDLHLPRPPVSTVADGRVASGPPVVIHPGAAYPSRRWPSERFAAVARWVAADGGRVVITGGPDEVGLADEVRRRAGLAETSVLAGRTGLIELAAVVAGARLVVCGDTGVAHLASAFGTPSVVLFGPTPPSRWGPPADGPHTVVWHGDGAGDPWGDEPDPALLEISVEEVLAALPTHTP